MIHVLLNLHQPNERNKVGIWQPRCKDWIKPEFFLPFFTPQGTSRTGNYLHSCFFFFFPFLSTLNLSTSPASLRSLWQVSCSVLYKSLNLHLITSLLSFCMSLPPLFFVPFTPESFCSKSQRVIQQKNKSLSHCDSFCPCCVWSWVEKRQTAEYEGAYK